MKKRLLSMLLVVCMVIAMLPVQVFAATDFTINSVDGTITYDELRSELNISLTDTLSTYRVLDGSTEICSFNVLTSGECKFEFKDYKVQKKGLFGSYKDFLTFTVSKVAEARSITFNSGASINYNFGLSAQEQYSNIVSQVLSSVVASHTPADAALNASNVKVQVETYAGVFLDVNSGTGSAAFNDTSETIRLVWAAADGFVEYQSATTTITLVESRRAVTADDITWDWRITYDSDVQAAIKAAVVVEDNNGNPIAADNYTVTATPRGEGYPNQYTVTVEVPADGASWLKTAAPIEIGTITATVNEYTVTFKNGNDVLQSSDWAYGETPVYTGETPTQAPDAQYTYTFAGWDKEIAAVTGDVTYTATYSTTTNEYTVTFVNEDGTELQSGKVAYGETPVYNGSTPSKDATAQYTYEFAGWTPAVAPVTGDVTYTATYTEAAKEYTVKFVNEDGTELQSGKVAYGETPAYTGETPTKTATAQYSYVFAGWDKEIAAVTGDVTYTATYTKTVNEYTVKFVNEDGTVLQSGKVAYGETPVYTGATPAKAATAQYTYTFKGWDKELVAVNGNVTYTAQFDSTVNQYTVTFVNEDGTVLQSGKVAYGETPAYTGETPAKAADEQYTYTFTGWTPAIVSVTGDAVYTATFTEGTPVMYDITWKNADDTTFAITQAAYGSIPTPPVGTPAQEATAQYTYTFIGWGTLTAVNGETSYTAQFDAVTREYTVTFVNADGTELQSGKVAYGTVPAAPADPTKAADAQYTYAFAGWDKEITAVTGDVTYTATYTETVNEYTVTFKDEDGTELQSGKVAYGTVPTAPADPAKAATNKYTYTFAGWDKTVVAVTGNVTYTATYTETVNKYAIGWDTDGDGDVDETTYVEYDAAPTHADPVKEYYDFTGWTPAITAVKGEAAYAATWKACNDENVNGVADEEEIAYVQVNVTGNGTVILSSSIEDTVITDLGDGKYSVFYDTTNEAARTLAVTATPADTGDTAKANYLISAPASAAIAPGGTSNVNVEFGYVEMTLADPVGAIWLNGYLFDAEKVTGLKAKVIEAAIGAAADPAAYTVEMSVRGYYVDVASGWNALTIAGALDVGQSETFRITLNGTDPVPSVSKTVSIAVKDSRQTLAIETENVTIAAKAEPADVADQIKAAIKITATDPQTGAETAVAVSDSYLSYEPAYAWPEDGQTGTFTVTVQVNALANATYSNAPSAALTLTLTDTTVFYDVVYMDGFSDTELDKFNVAEHTAMPTILPPDRENYSFAGWDIDGDGQVDQLPATVESNITCTAVWTQDVVYTITFLVDGVQHDVQTINLTTDPGTVVAKPADPDKDNAVFGGWTNGDVIGQVPSANVTLEAIWLADENNNNVADQDETITIEIIGNGKVAVNGKSATTSYPYDSTLGEDLVIVAIPDTTLGASKSYVASIAVDGQEQALAFGTGLTAFQGTATIHVESGSPKVTVTFKDAGFVFNDERLLNYYDGMTGVKNEDIYNAIVAAPVYSAEDAVADEYTVTYKARDKMTHSIPVDSLGLESDLLVRLIKSFAGDNLTFDMPELWLDVNVESSELSEKIANSVSLEQAVNQHLTKEKINGLLKAFNDAGGIGNAKEAYAAVEAELNALYEVIYSSAMYYGAHAFGYNATDAETVTEIIKVTYRCDAYSIEGQSDITLKDMRASSLVKGSNVSVMYKDYTDEELAAVIGAYVTDAAGNKIEGAVATASAIAGDYTFEGKGVSDTAYEIVFKFAGNESYRPSEATFTVTVTKAPAKMDLPNVIATYGEDYSVAPTLTLGNKYGEDKDIVDSLITFYIGLNIAELDVDENGVNGLNGEIKLMLTPDLQEKLDALLGMAGVDASDGVDMTLSELQEYLTYLDNGSLDVLTKALEAIAGVTENGDISITLGGTMPKDIGAYLYGGVSTNGNYDIVYDVGYIVIKPDAQRVYLDWNYTDDNGVFTWELLQKIDFGATAFDDEAFTTENAEATELIHELFFGVDEEGNFVAELDAITNADQLGNGAFVEMAFIAEFGNEFYYAVPIIRPIVIIPNLVDVVFEDANENDRFFFEFDNQNHGVTASVIGPDGTDITANGELTITYTGIQTNTQSWNSTEAPKHAGAYLVTAVYVEKNDNGDVTAMGLNTAIMVIGPTESTITVDNVVAEYTGEELNIADQLKIQAGSTVAGHTPDTTVITASLAATDDFSANGWSAVTGVVNIDFPKWVDDILLEHAPSIYDGMTPAEFNSKVTAKIPSIVDRFEAVLAENGMEMNFSNLENQLLDALDEIQSVVDQLSDNVTLRFDETDTLTANAVGTYLVIGVVTDSDHYPSMDAGVLLIVPSVEQAELKWNYTDVNGIITRPALDSVDLAASAFDREGAYQADATAEIQYLFVGLGKQGKISLTTDVNADFYNGAFTQVAYIPAEVSANILLAAPILRSFVIVPQSAIIHYEDLNENDIRVFTYDGAAKPMIPVVTDLDGKTIDTSKGTLTVTYVGADNTNGGYISHEAPANVGAYTVTTTYVEQDENGSYKYVGIGVGAMLIEKAPMIFDLLDTTVDYNGQPQFVDVNNPENADYVSVTVDKEANVANIVLEDDLTALVNLLAEAGIQVNTAYTLDELLTKVHNALDKAEGMEMPEFAAAAFEKVLAKLESIIPKSGTVTINGTDPVDAGTYQVYAVAYSRNFATEVSEGTLTIEPAKVTITVDDATKTYGEDIPELTYTAEGILEGDDLAIEIACEEGTDAGQYAITATYAANDNYVVTVENGTLTIEPAKVTITVANASKFYGEADPELTYTAEGIVEGDDLGIQVSREAGEDIGEYAITATYAANANYVVTVVDGTLVIKDASGFVLDGCVENDVLTISAENLSVYEQTANFLVATYKDGKLVEVHMENLIPVDGQSSWIKTEIQLDGSVNEVKFFALDKAHCPLAELWSWTADANN